MKAPDVLARRLLGRCGTTCVMYALLGLLLVSTAVLGRTVWSQTATLETGVELTGEIVNANVRTAGQAQRELLRLETALLADTLDMGDVELLRAFVTQRMGEMVLPYHEAALGTEALFTEARSIADRWATDIEPRVQSLVAAPDTATDAQVDGLVADVAALELAVNDLAADAEINRRAQAGSANEAAVEMLGSTRRLLGWLVVTLVGFVVVAGGAVRGWRRMVRQREQDLAEQLALATEVRTLSQVASSTDNMVIITDAAGRTVWVNEAFTRRTGYEFEEVRGLAPGDVLQGPRTDPATIDEMRLALARGEGFNVEIVNYDRDGQAYWVELDVQPVHDTHGRIEHFIAVQSDVTERREMEDRLVRAKVAAEDLATEKAMFLASMSHEIRTPLNAVIGLTGMLLDTDLDPKQAEYARTARRSGSLLLELVNNILSFSALESGKVEPEDRPTEVRDLVADTCKLFEERVRGKGLRLTWSVDDDVPVTVLTDPTRLRQVLVNLVGNAVKFTDAGEVRVEVASDRDQLVVRVSDSGIGVAPDVRSRLFQPFMQADSSTSRTHGGTGLGLAISRHLVELLGGEIDVDDAPGGGARFRFTVRAPAVGRAATPSAPPAPRSADARRDVRVLLAEDDAVNQIVAVALLERLGFVPDVVSDGHAVLAALDDQDYELVLMDIHMPGLDGLATTGRIRADLPPSRQPRIVAMTANALEGDRERFLASGMDGYVSKPVAVEALRGEIERVLAGAVLSEA